ncbi:MAG: hypothetical protein WAU01_14675 [Saprospiraceae bacterium]
MIITEALTYIPFSHLTRTQVAELLLKSPGSIDYYVRNGVTIDGTTIHLAKQPNGTFRTKDVIDFITIIKK